MFERCHLQYLRNILCVLGKRRSEPHCTHRYIQAPGCTWGLFSFKVISCFKSNPKDSIIVFCFQQSGQNAIPGKVLKEEGRSDVYGARTVYFYFLLVWHFAYLDYPLQESSCCHFILLRLWHQNCRYFQHTSIIYQL